MAHLLLEAGPLRATLGIEALDDGRKDVLKGFRVGCDHLRRARGEYAHRWHEYCAHVSEPLEEAPLDHRRSALPLP